MFSYPMDGNLVEVSEEKDLGVIIDKDFHSNTASVVNKANRRLYNLGSPLYY